MKIKTNKHKRKWSEIPASERERRHYIERDLDGYVHTQAGFLSRSAYMHVVRENPDAGLPEYEALPLMRSISY